MSIQIMDMQYREHSMQNKYTLPLAGVSFFIYNPNYCMFIRDWPYTYIL